MATSRMRRPAALAAEPGASKLWSLYWTAVTIITIGAALLGLSSPGPLGVSISLATLLVGVILLHALVPPVFVWLVRRVGSSAVRLLLLVIVPAAFLMAREGVFGEALAPSYSLVFHGSHRATESSVVSVAPSQADLAQRTIACRAAGGTGHVARGFAEAAAKLGCEDHPAAPATVRLELEAADAFCYLPLYKPASIAYRARILLEPGPGEPASSLEIEGRIDRTDYGFESCRELNRGLGREIAEKVLAHYRELREAQIAASTAGRARAIRGQEARAPRKPGAKKRR